MRLPPPMSWKGNVSENWKCFIQRIELYMIATDKDSKSDKIKIATLLHIMGEEGIKIYNTFTFSPNDAGTSTETNLRHIARQRRISPLKGINLI